MNRKEAEAIGASRYDCQAPCKHGHAPVRYTKTGICVECAAMNTAKTREKRSRRMASARQGLVDLSGVKVRPSDVETVMAVVDACNLMSGAPVSSRPVPLIAAKSTKHWDAYRDVVGDLLNAYASRPTTEGLSALTDALLNYGERGPATIPADRDEVLEVLDSIHQYLVDKTAQSWNYAVHAINRGPLMREGFRRGLIPDRMKPEPPLPPGVQPSSVYPAPPMCPNHAWLAAGGGA